MKAAQGKTCRLLREAGARASAQVRQAQARSRREAEVRLLPRLLRCSELRRRSCPRARVATPQSRSEAVAGERAASCLYPSDSGRCRHQRTAPRQSWPSPP